MFVIVLCQRFDFFKQTYMLMVEILEITERKKIKMGYFILNFM